MIVTTCWPMRWHNGAQSPIHLFTCALFSTLPSDEQPARSLLSLILSAVDMDAGRRRLSLLLLAFPTFALLVLFFHPRAFPVGRYSSTSTSSVVVTAANSTLGVSHACLSALPHPEGTERIS